MEERGDRETSWLVNCTQIEFSIEGQYISTEAAENNLRNDTIYRSSEFLLNWPKLPDL